MSASKFLDRSSRAALVGGLALLLTACSNGVAPRDQSFSGMWLGPQGVDTWNRLDLTQTGSSISGANVSGGVVGGIFEDSTFVTGTAFPPHAVLSWDEVDAQGKPYHFIIRATLSVDGQSMTGTLSLNGGTPMTISPYRRSTSTR